MIIMKHESLFVLQILKLPIIITMNFGIFNELLQNKVSGLQLQFYILDTYCHNKSHRNEHKTN
jgi:hypothetical protein